MPEVTWLMISVLLCVVGLVFTIIPVFPGNVLIAGGVVLYGWATEFQQVGWGVVGLVLGLTVVVLVFDQLAAVYGAKKVGGTWRGMVGAVIGTVVGVFVGLGIPGLILGPFVGAIIGELYGGKGLRESSKVGLGTLLGLLASALAKFTAGVISLVVFAVAVLA